MTPAGAANAGGAPPPDHTILGYDISWPQCGSDLPEPLGFAIIGVNGGRPNTTNPCLAAQLTWAAGTSEPAKTPPVALYVNTANPGPTAKGWWPTSNVHHGAHIPNPYGACNGADTAACAYIYGYAMAYDDVNRRGVPDAAHHMWWMDVETGNSWSSNRAANAADLEGMTAYLQSIGAEAGIYSTTYQFGEIAGTVGSDSNLNKLKNWVAGATSKTSARAYCSSTPLTPGGAVALTQFTAGSYDYNYPCRPLPSKQPAPPPKRQDPPHPLNQPDPPYVHSPMRFY
ncbi:hypothetical protein R5O87_14630 [Arthrobacter globiformis]|uniref:hypothetical protein n=1 Tax=Arthrobacter globiformis TaxID=1665 RepID=UPI00397C7C33